MADKVTWVGSRALEAQPEKWSFGDKVTCTLKFTGPYAKCKAERPARGSEVTGYTDFGLLVDTCEVDELEGEAGLLTVTLVSPQISEENYSTAAIGEPQFEIEFQEVTKKLETHPLCGTLSTAALEAGFTWDDWEEIHKDPSYYVEKMGGWDHSQYIAMKQKGIEEYPAKAPVVRRTTYHFAKPSDVGTNCFERQNPPISSFDALEDYEWIAGPDRATKQGRLYTRSSEWWGAEEWDTTLYPEA